MLNLIQTFHVSRRTLSLVLPSRQFHEGLGFLTNHGLLTNTFEYSLQQVNPKLTVPYWDFTVEGSMIGDPRGASSVGLLQENSPLFQETWFGTSDPSDNMVSFDSRG